MADARQFGVLNVGADCPESRSHPPRHLHRYCRVRIAVKDPDRESRHTLRERRKRICNRGGHNRRIPDAACRASQLSDESAHDDKGCESVGMMVGEVPHAPFPPADNPVRYTRDGSAPNSVIDLSSAARAIRSPRA